MPEVATLLSVQQQELSVNIRHDIAKRVAVVILRCRIVECDEAVTGIDVALALVGEFDELFPHQVAHDITECVREMPMLLIRLHRHLVLDPRLENAAVRVFLDRLVVLHRYTAVIAYSNG